MQSNATDGAVLRYNNTYPTVSDSPFLVGDSWLKFQWYRFENDPATIDAASFTYHRKLVRELREILVLWTDWRWFSSPVTSICWVESPSDLPTHALMKTSFLYLKMLRSITICKANLYVRKTTVTDHVLSAIESPLLKTSVNFPYQEKNRNISCNSCSAQLATGGCFCPGTCETNCNSNEHQ